MTLLAGVLVETARYDDARALAADARAVYAQSRLGPNHWRTAAPPTLKARRSRG